MIEEDDKDGARLIAGLEAQKKRYERFFETLEPAVVDVQATYAYTAVVKAIADVHKKMDPQPDVYAMSPEVMGEFVKMIRATPSLDKSLVKQVFSLIDRFFDEVKPQ